jgi:glycosidase
MRASLYDPDVIEILKASPTVTTTESGKDIPYPFPSPADWRDHWIYFLLVDRFDNPSSPPRPDAYPCNVYQGGNFAGIKQRLSYLKELGAGAIWLSPVLMNPPWFGDYWGGYGTLDFLRIEPRFCSDPERAKQDPEFAAQEFRSLVDEAHALGMYVILDIVLNHTGDVFAYEGHGDTAPWQWDHEYAIRWRNGQGMGQAEWDDLATVSNLPRDAGIWPQELQHNHYFRRKGGNDNEGDFGRMKELATDHKIEGSQIFPVRNYLIRAYQYLVAQFDLDGYRIDTLMYVEADFARVFGNAVREYALSIGKKNFFTFGEVWKDDDEAKIAEFVGRNTERDHELIGVDAAIDFPMRKRLVDAIKGDGSPADLARHFDHRRDTLKKIVSSHGDAGRHYVTFLDNHDLSQRFHSAAIPKRTEIALTCLMTLQGVPCVYYGTEAGLDNHGENRTIREYSREALWGIENAFSATHGLYQYIKDLSRLRQEQPVLRYGRQYFRPCSGNGTDFGYSPYKGGLIAFSRILNDGELLVVANTNTQENTTVFVVVDYSLQSDGKRWDILFPFDKRGQLAGTTSTQGGKRTVQLSLKPLEVLVVK